MSNSFPSSAELCERRGGGAKREKPSSSRLPAVFKRTASMKLSEQVRTESGSCWIPGEGERRRVESEGGADASEGTESGRLQEDR